MKTAFVAVGIAMLVSSVTPAWALFETNKELSEMARISMIDAIKTAQTTVAGKPVEVEMGKDDGKVVYKIEIIEGKQTRVVYVDAENGRVHEVKQ